MTVEKAIAWLNLTKLPLHGETNMGEEVINMAIQALEEVEQYRALGTVEELKEAKKLLEKLEELKFANEQPKTDWIPCTVVNHPEHCNDCEVTIKDTIGYFRDIAYYTDKWRRLADETPVNVIAWKEPSRPYKKEGAE